MIPKLSLKSDMEVAHDGVVKTVREWLSESGVSYARAYRRVRRLGWTIEEAVTTRLIGEGKTKSGINGHSRLVEFNGKVLPLSGWAKELGIAVPSVIKRLRRYPVEIALGNPRCDGTFKHVDGTNQTPPKREQVFSDDELADGVTHKTANQRLRAGWTREEASTVAPLKHGVGGRWGHGRGNLNRIRDLVALGIMS